MTTDFVSGLINNNIKTTAAQGRTFQTAENSVETGVFDSVFENVTKSYADKTEVKNENRQANNYANATKDINSAKKAIKNNSHEKTDRVTNNKKSINNSADNKQISKQSKSVQTKTQNNINAENTENISVKNDTSVKETDSKTIVERPAEKDSLQNSNFENNTVNRNDNKVAEQTDITSDNDLTAQTVIVQDKDKIEVKNDVENKVQINEATGQEEETLEVIPDFTEEQLISTFQATQNAIQLADIPIEHVQSRIISDDESNQNYYNVRLNTKNSETDLTSNVQTTQVEQIDSFENTARELIKEIQGTFSQNGSTVQELSKSVQNEFSEILNTQENTEIQFDKSIEKVIANNKEDLMIDDSNLEIETANINKEDLENITNTEAKNRPSARISSANAERLTLNLDKTSNEEELTVLNPAVTKAEDKEIPEVPQIQVTEEVAQNLKNFTQKAENKDFAGKVKDKITSKLGEVLGTSTVITEVQSQESLIQSGLNSNSQGNSSLAQGNAAEQAIKMSIETVNQNETSADSFISQLEARLNETSKTVNVKASSNLNLNKSDILSQINTKFNEMNQTGQSKVSIILRPENLGRVSVEIMNTKEGIIAKMTTDNQQVRELLDKNIDALRANLSSQGVNVNNIKVECTNQSENNAMDFSRQQFEENSQNFQDGNNHTNHSNKEKETAFWDNMPTQDEQEETVEKETTRNVETTKTIITSNGKINYKV